jgi:hypothetical protein
VEVPPGIKSSYCRAIGFTKYFLVRPSHVEAAHQSPADWRQTAKRIMEISLDRDPAHEWFRDSFYDLCQRI